MYNREDRRAGYVMHQDVSFLPSVNLLSTYTMFGNSTCRILSYAVTCAMGIEIVHIHVLKIHCKCGLKLPCTDYKDFSFVV